MTDRNIDTDAWAALVEDDSIFDTPQVSPVLAGDEAVAASRGLLAAVGRPSLGHDHAQRHGASPRRQVRLPLDTNTALDRFASEHHTTASAVIRDALDEYFAARS